MSKRWLAAFAAALLLSLGVLSQPASASLTGIHGTISSGPAINIPLVLSAPDNASASGSLGSRTSGWGSVTASLTGTTGPQDGPSIQWTIGVTGKSAVGGTNYDITFTIPVVGGPYIDLSRSAGMTVSDGSKSTSTSVQIVTIKSELDGTAVVPLTINDPAGLTALHDTKVVSYAEADQNTIYHPTSMTVEVVFTVKDLDATGSASLSGVLELSVIPEPATVGSALSGLLLCGLGYARRLRRKVA